MRQELEGMIRIMTKEEVASKLGIGRRHLNTLLRDNPKIAEQEYYECRVGDSPTVGALLPLLEEGKTLHVIAKLFGCSVSTIINRIEKYNIPDSARRTKRKVPDVTEETLIRLLEENNTPQKIASMLGVSRPYIYTLISKYNLVLMEHRPDMTEEETVEMLRKYKSCDEFLIGENTSLSTFYKELTRYNLSNPYPRKKTPPAEKKNVIL